MRYQVYIYKSTATTANAPAIGMCNNAVSTNSTYAWKENEAAHFMDNFDTAAISERIQVLVGDRCHIYAQQSPSNMVTLNIYVFRPLMLMQRLFYHTFIVSHQKMTLSYMMPKEKRCSSENW